MSAASVRSPAETVTVTPAPPAGSVWTDPAGSTWRTVYVPTGTVANR